MGRIQGCMRVLACLCGLCAVTGCGAEDGEDGTAATVPPVKEEVGEISLTEATKLAHMGDQRAVEPLCAALVDSDDVLHRVLAARNLRRLKATRSVPVLVGEHRKLSRVEAADELARLLRKEVVSALEAITGIRQDFLDPAESIRLWMEWYGANSDAPPR